MDIGGRLVKIDKISKKITYISPKIDKIIKLNDLAAERGQTLAQMALAWNLRDDVTSVIIGASSTKQVEDNIKAIENLNFSSQELNTIENILKY